MHFGNCEVKRAMLLRTKSINLGSSWSELFAFDKYLLGAFSASGRCLSRYLHLSNLYPSQVSLPSDIELTQYLFRELNHKSRALLLEAD